MAREVKKRATEDADQIEREVAIETAAANTSIEENLVRLSTALFRLIPTRTSIQARLAVADFLYSKLRRMHVQDLCGLIMVLRPFRLQVAVLRGTLRDQLAA